jgi:hypothetical protein
MMTEIFILKIPAGDYFVEVYLIVYEPIQKEVEVDEVRNVQDGILR